MTAQELRGLYVLLNKFKAQYCGDGKRHGERTTEAASRVMDMVAEDFVILMRDSLDQTDQRVETLVFT